MAKKIYGQSMYLKQPQFPSYGGLINAGSAYAVDQSYSVDTDYQVPKLTWPDNYDYDYDHHTYQIKRAIQEIEKHYDYARSRYEHMRRNVNLAAEAPTQQDLDDFPALKSAWDQYIIVKTLIKGQ